MRRSKRSVRAIFSSNVIIMNADSAMGSGMGSPESQLYLPSLYSAIAVASRKLQAGCRVSVN
jgi:hypothetical protein